MNVSNIRANINSFKAITATSSITPVTVAALFTEVANLLENADSDADVRTLLTSYVSKSKLHETVEELENIISTIQRAVSSYETGISSVRNTANEALLKSNEAKTAAVNAVSTANNAVSTASNALSSATRALNTANSALSAASNVALNSSGTSSSKAAGYHIEVVIENQYVVLQGPWKELLKKGYRPVLFRKCKKINRVYSPEEERDIHGDRKKGWVRMGNINMLKVSESTGVVSFSNVAHNRLNTVQNTNGTYRLVPEVLINTHRKGTVDYVSWGCSRIKMNKTLHLPFAIGFTKDTKLSFRDPFDYSSLVTNLATFHVTYGCCYDDYGKQWYWVFSA